MQPSIDEGSVYVFTNVFTSWLNTAATHEADKFVEGWQKDQLRPTMDTRVVAW